MNAPGNQYYLKWTRSGRVPSYQGGDPIPVRKWTERVENPELCERGWHACRWEDAISHISDELWVVQLDGAVVEGDDKVAAERLRIVRRVRGITERNLRLFAADCAERALLAFEAARPGDDRPRQAIAVVRRFAEGKASCADLSAARSAAWSAARSAARSPAAWSAESAARSAAWSADSAARSAAWSAARSAAWSPAAWSAEESEMNQWLLVHYCRLDPEMFVHRADS